MYTVSKIDSINETTFNSIYESNKTQLVQNIGYDDLNNLRSTFQAVEGMDKIFFHGEE